ncbi:hypothetical protein BDU57DRAFT_516989 [Ampelomyces quisqualis]|uniref:Uncharacterized protein n=1 Tax=Ampelomyces quisqualis TaxID=50730 RepID=A0A6A5QLS2_AMPQU|nr:hypothetical protein BDU57DRAFT_516989 [Ampelomyces quisqualis]
MVELVIMEKVSISAVIQAQRFANIATTVFNAILILMRADMAEGTYLVTHTIRTTWMTKTA